MPATTADLTGYTDAARRAIESEAYVWLHGDQNGARRMYDRQREWARKLDADARRYHSAGSWHANDLLRLAAISEVQRDLGEPGGWRGGPARLNPGF
jgi:hypothetical protein